MSDVIDLYQVYQFIKRLSTPFNETNAYKLGIIDEKGKLLKSPKSKDEKSAYNPYNRMIFNLKRIMSKVGIESKLSSFAAALFLLKENKLEFDEWDYKRFIAENKLLIEEVAANAVGGGNIAGASPGEDPPVYKRALKRYKKKNANTVLQNINTTNRKLFNQVRIK